MTMRHFWVRNILVRSPLADARGSVPARGGACVKTRDVLRSPESELQVVDSYGSAQRTRRADFNPRGASAPLYDCKAEALRGLKPALPPSPVLSSVTMSRRIIPNSLTRAAPHVVFVAAAIFAGAATDPLADLKSGSVALDNKRYSAAIATLKPLAKRIPKLADYAAWFLASAQFGAQDYKAVEKSLQPVWKQSPPSPLAARAVILAARAYGQNGQTKEAVEILRQHYATLPQPQGDLAMANAFEAAGDRVSAAVYFQRVYYGFPVSQEAAQAESEMAELGAQMGAEYPPAMPDAMLGRAFKLLNAGSYVRAKRELESILPDLGGAERDLARVRIGVADYNEKETLRAEKYLESLHVDSAEPDAERLSYLVQCARRLKNHEQIHAMLDKLPRANIRIRNGGWRRWSPTAICT